ncbi:SDR family oxidoreductase [Candidatus Thiosymbion oneisti]|uniref:SDR family oxidoreductase n=1 Tax=Candidatus Thiosymbion oneisti TaxID=589554 RepID=UPI000AF48A75|nr:SDR family oxidoreductase [Candidatus Thiosymbion oneisti]
MRKTLIIGATSAIAQATARRFSAAGDALFLVARNADRLPMIADDLRIRGASRVRVQALDVLDYDRYQAIIETAIEALDGLDLVLIAHGTLPDQRTCEGSFAATRAAFEINALSTISLVTYLADYFEASRQGTIVVITSVAGDRGRQSNYVYGSAKGAVTIFLQGLRNRLHQSGVKVITIKPGFVDTPMTSAFEKGALWATPEQIADRIVSSIAKGIDVSYAPAFWRPVMALIRSIPERFFKRMKL